MSFKYLNMKLGILALGLVVIIGMSAILGVSEQVKAATTSPECVKTLSGQAQACATESDRSPLVKAAVTTWFFPPATPKAVTVNPAVPGGSAKTIKSTSLEDKESTSGILELKALILFAAAFAGIVFLGRRKKFPVRKD